MTLSLHELATRESEQIEWKEHVADPDDVVATLSAFANDLQNLGGGYVVCGAREARDEHGFPILVKTGLPAARLKELEHVVLARCRDRVAPPITPVVEELPSDDPQRRLLVFVQAATSGAHTFRRGGEGARHHVRVSRETREARNGVLLSLLVRKRELEPWDRRPCPTATERDLDLVMLRDTLQRMQVLSAERSLEAFLSAEVQLSPFVPPLFAREPLTGALRPRNFALLLFGVAPQRFIPGAVAHFSVYPGLDRLAPHALRHDLAGTLVEQARRLQQLLDEQIVTVYDKTDATSPNASSYPRRALYEAMGNALAHRDYESDAPTRVTAFADRIEVTSPGALPHGVTLEALRSGRSAPAWRNQALAWFLARLHFAQAEGQGISTILHTMQAEGCPPPTFEADAARVSCVLPAHPRSALFRELKEAGRDLARGAPALAAERLRRCLDAAPFHAEALELFAEVQLALRDREPLARWLNQHEARVNDLPLPVLLAFGEALAGRARVPPVHRELVRPVLEAAATRALDEPDLHRILGALDRIGDHARLLHILERHLREQPGWAERAPLLALRGTAQLELAARPSHRRAKQEQAALLGAAERDLRAALARTAGEPLRSELLERLEDVERCRRSGAPEVL